MERTLFLLEWAENHTRLFQVLAALATILTFLTGLGLGWVLKIFHSRKRRRQYHNLENPGVVVFEGHILEEMSGGTIRLRVSSWGGKHTLASILDDPVLELILEKHAHHRRGFLCLDQPGQLLVMDGFEEKITGNDSSANVDVLKNRPANVDPVLMCPVTWPGRRAAHLIRVVMIDPPWIDRLRDPAVISRIVATRRRYQYRAEWLHKIALRWPEESGRDEEDACMRIVEMESQRLR